MKKQVLFVHSGGAQGWRQGSSYLLHYLRIMLGSDYHIVSPKMPEPEHPEYHLWETALNRDFAMLRKDAILVGHSLGGSVLLKYLSERNLQLPISGLFIVAAPYWGSSQWEVDEYRLTTDFQQNLTVVNKLVLYHSRNDEVVPFSHLDMYASKLPWATIRETHGYHLFQHGLPELVADIKALTPAIQPTPSARPTTRVQEQRAVTTLNPYLHFSGQCREAMNFYKHCLGGELTLQSVKDSGLEAQCPAAIHHHILHASLVNDGLVLFATDIPVPGGVQFGNTVSLSLTCTSDEEIEACFRKLSAGARVTEGLRKQHWGAKFGALVDKYGVGWMLYLHG